MKIFNRLGFLVMVAFSATMFTAEGAQTERSITFALSGFFEDINTDFIPSVTNAVPFRATTKDILNEISDTTGQDFSNGVLLLIESLPQDTNSTSKVVARKKIAIGVTNELNVSEFFIVDFGEEVKSLRSSGGFLRSKTLYANDQFQFSTLGNPNGDIALTLQGFSRQMEVAFRRTISETIFTGLAANLTSDVNGEVFKSTGFVGPVKGRFTIGAPKFVATPAPLN